MCPPNSAPVRVYPIDKLPKATARCELETFKRAYRKCDSKRFGRAYLPDGCGWNKGGERKGIKSCSYLKVDDEEKQELQDWIEYKRYCEH